ncbi:MAG: DUF4954 family protein, partial [Planctomycetes bacterium]|nr:DUF4954 family protein [Planctomycetota bacterium]
VWIGDGARIEGAAALVDCYLADAADAPVRIGEGVAAEDCVFLGSAEVEGGVRLGHCLVGEGVSLSGGFSAKHSLFFANSQFALGEASCSLAGPFAVSTHKATLVLTSQCSFCTFGSAANASNHHFKLGPLHGGVLRRGVRCGSGSYLFWPADIGAFTTVVGRHCGHLDTVDFPFSLLLAKDDRSVLVPGVNLFTSGSFRDADKWARRDRRQGVRRPRDLVNPAVLSPYTLQAMETGVALLERCREMEVDLRHGGAVIPAGRIEPALALYRAALVFHTGLRLLLGARDRRQGAAPRVEDFMDCLEEATAGEDRTGGTWRDWGGMLLPGVQADQVLADLADGRLTDADALQARLEELHAGYDGMEREWLARRWIREYGDPTRRTVSAFVAAWRQTVQFRHACFVKDAGKEFTPECAFGFGVEGNAGEYFRRIRGSLTDHPLLAMAEAERETLIGLAEFIPPPDGG